MNKSYNDDASQSSSIVIRYIYVLLTIIVIFTFSIFSIIKQQNDTHAKRTLQTHNFYLVGINLTNKIRENIDRARLELLQEDIRHQLDHKSHIQHGQQDKYLITNIINELQEHNSRLQTLHKKFNDPDFIVLIERLDRAINQEDVEHIIAQHSAPQSEFIPTDSHFKSIYATAHQIERLYDRKLDTLNIEDSSYFNAIDTQIKSVIIILIIVAIVFTMLILKAIRQIGNEQVSSTRQLNQFKTTLDSTNDCVFMFTADTLKFTYCNNGAMKQIGYGFDELLTMSPFDIKPEFNESQFKEMILPMLKGETDFMFFETIHQHKDGHKIPVEIGLQYNHPENETPHFLAIVRDVTEQRKARDELRQSEERLRTVFEKAGVGITQVSLDGNFLTVNAKLCDILGYNEHELMSLTFQDITHPDDLEKDLALMNQTLAGDFPSYSIDKRYFHNDRSIVWVNLSVTLVRDVQKQPLYFISVIEDITSRKEAEIVLSQYQHQLEELVDERTEELRNTQDELVRKERLATLGNLTATVSHELRNPLGAMRPSLYVIEAITKDNNNEKLQTAIQRLNRGIGRCDNIIDELLDFTRITELSLQSVVLDDWLGEVLHEQPLLNGIDLVYQPGLDKTQVHIDADRMRRAFINVFENACHAMLVDNSTSEVIDNAMLTIHTQIANERINLSISDSGSGISDEVMEKIFEPLFSTKGFGVGLGMPTVQQIMKQHKGGIDIDTSSKGTTVTLWLPLAIYN